MTSITWKIVRAACVAAIMTGSAASAQDRRAIEVVRASLAAQGGEARLRGIRNISWDSVGYRNELEQSERPEGPYITEFTASSEFHDFAGNRFSASDTITVYPAYTTTQRLVVAKGVAMVANGSSNRAGTSDDEAYARERMALSPERLLLTALDAPTLSLGPDVMLQSVPQHVIRFTLDGATVTVFLNADTHLPTAWEYSGPLARRGFWRFAGDTTMRTYFSFWWLAKGGIHLPMQWAVETNGFPERMFSIKKLVIDGPADEKSLGIPETVSAAYRANSKPVSLEDLPLGLPNSSPVEIKAGIVLIPGRWNVTIIRQDDGIVILEAPISSGYSEKVMAEAHRRFPDLPIKAVVTTSDSWPHIAGIRAYAAQGVPIYLLDRNRPIIRRWLSAPRTQRPDALALRQRAAKLRVVDGGMGLGSGANRLVLYPIRGETSERQMMVYFPQHRLLYGSDPFQRSADGSYFVPQTVSELLDAVARERISVDTYFMMHIAPTPWSDLNAVITLAGETQSPTGEF